jgi:hypothetical protein
VAHVSKFDKDRLGKKGSEFYILPILPVSKSNFEKCGLNKKEAYLQNEGWPIIGIPASLEIFCKDNVKLRKASSLTVR